MKTMLLVTAATLALTGGGYAATNHMSAAGGARGTAQRVIHVPPRGMTTLYDQNVADVNYGWFSQTLSSYPQYDEYLADDFVIPAGHTWKIEEVDTTGFYFNEPGPAKSVNVLFWKNRKHFPNIKGGPAIECDNIKPRSGLDTGAFQIKLPKTCAVRLAAGKNDTAYWVTVQANMVSEGTSGYWAWQQNANIANNEASGYYYGGSSGAHDPKCSVRFETIQDCWSAGGPVDLAFALLGRDSSN